MKDKSKTASAGSATAEESSPPYETISKLTPRSWQNIPLGEYFGRPSSSSPRRTRCNICGMSFRTASGIAKHMRGHGKNAYGNVTTIGGE